MESEKYLEGQSMQRPPLFESDGFIYWKNRFETYVKSKDLDLWHVITDGDFPPIQNNPETKKDEVVPFHKQNDDLKKKLAKNNEAKMYFLSLCVSGHLWSYGWTFFHRVVGLTNLSRLLKNFLKSLTAIAYSSSSLSEVELSSSIDSV
ncbi:hypothetical protein Tco_1097100 [Tanacetum coccineum]